MKRYHFPEEIKKLSLTIATLLLFGCAKSDGLSTQNTLLNINTLQAKSTLDTVKLSSFSWPKENWWENFNDPQLTALINDAQVSNPNLQIVNAQAAQANAQIIAAQASLYPDLDAHAGITRSRLAKVDDPYLVGKDYSTLRTATLSASYTFDLWGGQKDAALAAIGSARAAELDRQATKITLAANVTRAWYNLNLAWLKQKLGKENLLRARSIAGIQRQYMTAGLSSGYQYKQALSQQKNAESSLTEARQNVTKAGIHLSSLVGKGPDYWHKLKPANFDIPKEATLPTTIPADLLGRRPDIIAARWRVEAATKTIDSTKTEFYPNINLAAEYGTKSLLGDALFGAPSRYFQLAPSLSLPIFDGGRRRADLAESNANWDLAVAQYNKLVINSLNNISETITELKSNQEELLQQENASELIHSAWQDLNREHDAGLRPYLDVLSIQNQLIEQDEKLIELKAQQINLAVVLIENLGGGFQEK